jgi:hypothetical protein
LEDECESEVSDSESFIEDVALCEDGEADRGGGGWEGGGDEDGDVGGEFGRGSVEATSRAAVSSRAGGLGAAGGGDDVAPTGGGTGTCNWNTVSPWSSKSLL